MEKNLDKIASGKINYLDFMNNFYRDLKSTIENTKETGLTSDSIEKTCPNCGKPMVMRRSRFGKLFYGCSMYPKCTGILNID
jgi:DNA topoisomerase-1